MINLRDNPHEKRFEIVPMSMTWSNLKKIPQYSMSKTFGRETNNMYGNK
jgi:hypothetical protein